MYTKPGTYLIGLLRSAPWSGAGTAAPARESRESPLDTLAIWLTAAVWGRAVPQERRQRTVRRRAVIRAEGAGAPSSRAALRAAGAAGPRRPGSARPARSCFAGATPAA